jgi:hypothetical protein
LIADLAVNAPHVECSVVFPGNVGTSISSNTRQYLSGGVSDRFSDEQVERTRTQLAALGRAPAELTEERIQAGAADFSRRFLEDAPTTAAEAAAAILAGVKAGQWRILVGEDAKIVDEMVRAEPEASYSPEFFARVQSATNWTFTK